MNNYITPHPSANRIDWLDCIRAFAMIYVIFYHLPHCYGFFSSCFLEIFFFISGFTTFKAFVDFQWLKDRAISRFLSLIIPTFVIGSIYVLTSEETFETLFLGGGRAGYWFTVTMFEVFLVYAVLTYILDRFSFSIRVKTTIYLLIIAISLICFRKLAFLDDVDISIYHALSLQSLTRFMPHFLLGVIAKIHAEKFFKFIESNILLATVLLVWLFCAFIASNYSISITKAFTSFCGTLVVFRFFYSFRETFSSNTCIGRGMIYIGKRTLAVYLMHYFFLDNIRLMLDGTLFMDFIKSYWFFGTILTIILAIIITFACLAVEKALLAFPMIHGLLLGFNIKKKSLLLPL